MTREQLKKNLQSSIDTVEIFSGYNYDSAMRETMRDLLDTIIQQDAYIDALTKFIEEITLSGGKYKHLNGDIIIADAYKILGD